MKKHYLSVLAIVGLFVMASSAFASHYGDTFGYSTKGMSLGNAMCARVDDWSSVYYNIAGLGKTLDLKYGKNQLGVAYQKAMPVFDIDINRYDADGPLATNGDKNLDAGTLVLGLALDAGLIMHLPSFVSSARFGLSLGVNDDLTAVKANDISPYTHNFMRYGREAQRLEVLSGMGFGFKGDAIGFGLGVNSAFEGDGKVLLTDVQLQTAPQSPKGETLMNMKIKPHVLLGMYLSPGKMVDSLEGLDFGFCFRDETILNIDPFKTATVTDVGGIVLNLDLAITDYYQPRMYTVGTAYRMGAYTLSLDLEYQEWSGFHMSTPMTTNYAAEIVKFDDIYIPRVGLECNLSQHMSAQFGYYYQQSFIPDEAVSGHMNFLDNDKHVGSVGLTVDFPSLPPLKGHTELSLGYQLQYLVDRDVVKTNDPGNTANPNYSYGGLCHTFMVGLSINL